MPKKSKTKVKPKALLVCPHCHAEWAEFTYKADGTVRAKDVKVLLGKKVFKDGDVLECSVCSHPHNTWDMALAIAAANMGKHAKP